MLHTVSCDAKYLQLKRSNMKCPNCDETLLMSDKNGIEIDYCPKCRGIWLDRGELDKIIERSTEQSTPNNSYPPDTQRDNNYRDQDFDRYKKGHHKKKESWFGDLFDF